MDIGPVDPGSSYKEVKTSQEPEPIKEEEESKTEEVNNETDNTETQNNETAHNVDILA